jgi:hypothetical protein
MGDDKKRVLENPTILSDFVGYNEGAVVSKEVIKKENE